MADKKKSPKPAGGPKHGKPSEETAPVYQNTRPLEVRLQLYEGPLDLLLDIIRKHEMDIFDIPMVEVTEQYLAYLNKMKMLNLEIAGDFMVMAATLIYIKSRMLLPQEKDEAMEEEGQDPRLELVQKLLEYQAFREAASELGLLEVERSQEFTRQIAEYYFKNLSSEEAQIDTFSAGLYDLITAFHQVMKSISAESFHEVFQEVVSIEEKIEHVKQMLRSRSRICFHELFTLESSRNEFIVTFLAILELAKLRFLCVVQEERFGEIFLTLREEQTSAAM